MTFLKTAAAAFVIAAFSVLPALSAEAQLIVQAADGTVQTITGTVAWQTTADDTGAPGLAATVAIDEAKVAAAVTMTKNNDASLPATHIFEATFTPGAEFAGKSVAQLAGVMMRKGEDLQGTPLPGASATIVTNQFIFAPSGPSPSGTTLGVSKWMDLALVFETGQRALLALEIDDAARATLQQMAL
jgi:hypothetical protein